MGCSTAAVHACGTVGSVLHYSITNTTTPAVNYKCQQQSTWQIPQFFEYLSLAGNPRVWGDLSFPIHR